MSATQSKDSGDLNGPGRKRKITEYLHQTPIKTEYDSQVKSPIIPTVEQHESGEDGFEDEAGDSEVESVAVHEGPILAPKHVLEFKKAFEEHLKLSKHNTATARQLKKLATDFASSRVEYADNKEKMVSSLVHYMRQAIRMASLNVGIALNATDDFLSRGSSVTVFPDFPKGPARTSYLYAKAHNMDLSVTNVKNVHLRMNEDPEGKEKAEKDEKDAAQKYLTDLEAFLEKHHEADDLTKAQIEHVQKMIANRRKLLEPPQKRLADGSKAKSGATANNKRSKTKSGTTTNKKKSKQLSPFEVFCQAHPEMYVDCSPEKRMRKMQKKYDKLDEEDVKIYVNISSGLAG